MELISGERLKREEYTDEIDLAVKNIITYSENEITQKTKALKKKVFACILLTCLALLILIPALNGVIWGDGFSWECIPAYWCAQKAAEAIQAYDEKSIQTYIGNSEGVFTAVIGTERTRRDDSESGSKIFAKPGLRICSY